MAKGSSSPQHFTPGGLLQCPPRWRPHASVSTTACWTHFFYFISTAFFLKDVRYSFLRPRWQNQAFTIHHLVSTSKAHISSPLCWSRTKLKVTPRGFAFSAAPRGPTHPYLSCRAEIPLGPKGPAYTDPMGFHWSWCLGVGQLEEFKSLISRKTGGISIPLKKWSCLNKVKKFRWCIIEQGKGVIYTIDVGNAEKTLQGRAEPSPLQILQLTFRALKISFVARGEKSRYDFPLILCS